MSSDDIISACSSLKNFTIISNNIIIANISPLPTYCMIFINSFYSRIGTCIIICCMMNKNRFNIFCFLYWPSKFIFSIKINLFCYYIILKKKLIYINILFILLLQIKSIFFLLFFCKIFSTIFLLA